MTTIIEIIRNIMSNQVLKQFFLKVVDESYNEMIDHDAEHLPTYLGTYTALDSPKISNQFTMRSKKTRDGP